MKDIIVYRNRHVTRKDICFIRGLIADNPEDGRSALSRKICRAWNWAQPNGHLKDMICRGLLLRLETEGHIKLPARKGNPPPNPFLHRKDPQPVEVKENPIQGTVKGLYPITFQQVRRTQHEKLFNWLIHKYHYLGYTQPVGEHLKYLVFSQGRPIAALAWSSPAWHLGPRDRFIGWRPQARKRNLHLIAYNTRFLILQWIKVPHLASHLLSRCAKTLSNDWQTLYNHPIWWLETFVDTERFRGTCYRAANWRFLGKTTGRGKNDQTNRPNRSIKAIYGYPLSKDFRNRLCNG
jgi:hypothetical protein